MKTRIWLGLALACAVHFWHGAPRAGDFSAAAQVQHMQHMQLIRSAGYHQTKAKYDLVGWPREGGAPLEFRSAFYKKDSASFVHLDGDKFFFKADSLIRYPADFDSLKVVLEDGTLRTARVTGAEWAFVQHEGPAAVYASEPVGTWSFMDTGAGLVPYSEKALRRKLKERPAAARALRIEKIANGVNWGCFLGGLALMGTGLALSEETRDEYGEADGGIRFSPLVPAGLGLAVAGWIPYLIAQPQYVSAIKAYNRAPEDAAPVAPPPARASGASLRRRD